MFYPFRNNIKMDFDFLCRVLMQCFSKNLYIHFTFNAFVKLLQKITKCLAFLLKPKIWYNHVKCFRTLIYFYHMLMHVTFKRQIYNELWGLRFLLLGLLRLLQVRNESKRNPIYGSRFYSAYEKYYKNNRNTK